jgi:hypothetical protein
MMLLFSLVLMMMLLSQPRVDDVVVSTSCLMMLLFQPHVVDDDCSTSC